jgi:hypothetical protein
MSGARRERPDEEWGKGGERTAALAGTEDEGSGKL